DLVNGLVHMYMDNNDDYVSPAGPLIAGFHLHHKLPRYTDRPLPEVYFLESGSKVWLAPCLAAGLFFSLRPEANPFAVYALAYFGVLSSVAEVSHYLAHNSLSPAAAALARAGLLLSKRRHGRHHTEDNVSYTFLNGFTDPVVDLIARKLYSGYKNGTDLHYVNYKAAGRR
ncbi:MAG TPA: fatty acid desaturase CarF family protein, partial [Elusimicrobiales bacterium]|nr:fatty acid desaturase CarF family protein [Elusimicrobiales bacterium]